jgi:hypothetical protein
MLDELQQLASRFDELAMPKHGRYVRQPAITNADGVVSVPPPVADHLPAYLAAAAVLAAAGLAAGAARRRSERARL